MTQATLGTLLRRLIELLDGDVEALYRHQRLDYRPRFTPVMRALAEHGPASIRQIQARTPLSHSALSQTIAEMNKRGLVALLSGRDGRERIVALSPAAQAMMPLLQKCWTATNASAIQLSEEIGVSLETAISAAIHALERRPYFDRIIENLEAPASVVDEPSNLIDAQPDAGLHPG